MPHVATITATAPTFAKGHRHVVYDADASELGNGDPLTLGEFLWIVSDGGVIDTDLTSFGRRFEFVKETAGLRVDLKVRDRAGNEAWATPHTGNDIDETADDYEQFVSSVSGNDTNNGLTTLTKVATIAQAMTNIVAASLTTGQQAKVWLEEGETFDPVTIPGIDEVRIVLQRRGSTAMVDDPVILQATTTAAGVQNTTESTAHSLVDVFVQGGYTFGGAGVGSGHIGVLMNRAGTAANFTVGNSFVMLRGGIDGFFQSVGLDSTTAGAAGRGLGRNSFAAIVQTVMTDAESSHVAFCTNVRYLCLDRIQQGRRFGTSTGSGFRLANVADFYIRDCATDNTGASAFQSNSFRLVGGSGADADNVTTRGTVINHSILGGEGFEIDTPSVGTLYYLDDVEFIHPMHSGVTSPAFNIGAGAGSSYDVTDLVIRNAECRSKMILQVQTDSSTVAAKIHSILAEGCSNVTNVDGAFFTPQEIGFAFPAIDANVDDDAITLVGNFAGTTATGTGGDTVCFVRTGASFTAANKIAASDYNCLAKNSAGHTWSQTQNLATWTGATGLDTNSVEATEAPAVTDDGSGGAGTQDHTPTSGGSQIDLVPKASMPWVDASGHIRANDTTATLTAAGSVDDGEATEPDGPAFGPDAPSDLAAVAAGSTALLVTLTDNSGGTADHDLQYRVSGDSEWTEWSTMQAGDESATITGLSAVTGYDVRARATTEDGSSDWVETTGTTSGNNLGSVTASIIAGSRSNRLPSGRRR